MIIRQFHGTRFNISLLKRGERYRCNICNLNFVQQDELDFYNSGTVVDKKIPEVYCPICTSCHLRFLPALRTFEELSVEPQPYSLVTVLDSELNSSSNYFNIMKTAIVAAFISAEIDASSNMTIKTLSGSKMKINLDEKCISKYTKLVNNYKKFSLQLAYNQYGVDADPKTPKTYHIPEQHKKLGVSISDAFNINKTLSESYIDKVIVVPSIEQIVRLISLNIYSRDELIDFSDAPEFGE